MGFCASSNSVRCRPSVSFSFPSSPYIVNIPASLPSILKGSEANYVCISPHGETWQRRKHRNLRLLSCSVVSAYCIKCFFWLWRLSPAHVECGANRKWKPCSWRIHLPHTGWAAVALSHGWVQSRKCQGLSTGWAPFLLKALEAGWWKRGRDRWRYSHSLPGSLMRGDQEVAHERANCQFSLGVCVLLAVVSLTAPAGTHTL